MVNWYNIFMGKMGKMGKKTDSITLSESLYLFTHQPDDGCLSRASYSTYFVDIARLKKLNTYVLIFMYWLLFFEFRLQFRFACDDWLTFLLYVLSRISVNNSIIIIIILLLCSVRSVRHSTARCTQSTHLEHTRARAHSIASIHVTNPSDSL